MNIVLNFQVPKSTLAVVSYKFISLFTRYIALHFVLNIIIKYLTLSSISFRLQLFSIGRGTVIGHP